MDDKAKMDKALRALREAGKAIQRAAAYLESIDNT